MVQAANYSNASVLGSSYCLVDYPGIYFDTDGTDRTGISDSYRLRFLSGTSAPFSGAFLG